MEGPARVILSGAKDLSCEDSSTLETEGVPSSYARSLTPFGMT